MTYTCPACLKGPLECECSRWCEFCDCQTNHTTAQHKVMEEFTEQEG